MIENNKNQFNEAEEIQNKEYNKLKEQLVEGASKKGPLASKIGQVREKMTKVTNGEKMALHSTPIYPS